MKLNEQNIINKLFDKDKIVFKVIKNDINQEITLIAPFIKKYKKDNPKKDIVVYTKPETKFLYLNYINDVFDFKILKNTHKDYFTIDFGNITNEDTFNLKKLCYDIETSETSKNIIKMLKEIYSDKIIVINPYTKSGDNFWLSTNWNLLFDLLSTKTDFLFLIYGNDNEYFKPIREHYNIHLLEDICKKYKNLNSLELLVESIKQSKLIFGTQESFIIQLSNLLKTPTCYIGYNNDVSKSNALNTKSDILKCKVSENQYIINYDKVFNQLIELIHISKDNQNNEIDDRYEEIEIEESVYKDPILAEITDPEKRKEYLKLANHNSQYNRFVKTIVKKKILRLKEIN